MGAPGARPFTSLGLAIANVLGTCVQLNGDGLDPAHGLVAVAAARAVHCGRFVDIEKKSAFRGHRRGLSPVVQPSQDPT